jgi:oxaloacetate decarboxylase gamma subunit
LRVLAKFVPIFFFLKSVERRLSNKSSYRLIRFYILSKELKLSKQLKKMENLGYGLLLMAVGMVTVFLILLIVIGLGKGLIKWVNRYIPEDVAVRPARSSVAAPGAGTPVAGVPNQTVAAIVSAVSVVTGGKGKVTSIEQ